MILKRASFLAAALVGAVACNDDDGGVTDIQPGAGIRYVNAVPDTLPLDFHAVDIVENSPYISTAFREIKQAGYSRAQAGDRHFRVFPSSPGSPSINVVSQIIADVNTTLQPNA